MKKLIVSCPNCGIDNDVKIQTYAEMLDEIKTWLKEEPNDIAAKDTYEDILQYSRKKKEYLSWFYLFTPIHCVDCKEPFYYDYDKKMVKAWIDRDGEK